MLGSMPRMRTTSRSLPGGRHRDAGGRPLDPAADPADQRHGRPVDLEVVVVLGVERGQRLGVPDQLQVLDGPVAASPASFQPSKATTTNGSVSWGRSSGRTSGRSPLRAYVDPAVATAPSTPSVWASPATAGPTAWARVSSCSVSAHGPSSAPGRHGSADRAAGTAILVLDGAMGTAIQRDRPDEAGYRGERFADWPTDVQGNNDLLSITPEIIAGIHREYLEAGADLIETNTFNATAISLSDYGMQDLAYELNVAAARLARQECDATERTPDKPRYVVGAIGPTSRTASISPDVNDPGARNVTFDELVEAYLEQANGLVDGGADVLIVETIFDTLNAKAAIFALETLFEERGRRWPVMISGRSPTPPAGRCPARSPRPSGTPCGTHPLLVGLNCALGARRWPYIAELSRIADTFVSCYPNAGLPNAFGEYDESPRRPPPSCRSSPRAASSTSSVAAAGRRRRTSPRSPAVVRARGRRSRRARPPAVRTGAGDRHRRDPVRERRRAHEHHRLRPLPQPDQGRRLPPRSRSPASRWRPARRSSTSTWTRG